MSFSKILSAAALASLFAGILLTLVQQVGVIPSILEAEKYENSTAADTKTPITTPAYAEHSHDSQAWAPQDGLERTFFTFAANILIAMGFALLLGAAATLSGKYISWKSGLLWGLAGYIVFFVAPSLGLTPELPGTEAAALQTRQIWWAATAICTAGGLALMVFAPNYLFKGIGVIMLVVPHLVGAPQPEHHAALAPQELITTFIIATAIANAVFWLSLGGAYGFFNRKLMDQA